MLLEPLEFARHDRTGGHELFPGRIVIHLRSPRPASREIAAATRKADLARAVFQCEIVFAPDPGMQLHSRH